MYLVCGLIISSLIFVNGFDQTKLWKIPPPMKNYHVPSGLGRWYYQFNQAACSWSGSREYSDYEIFLEPESKNSLLFTLTMRNEFCNTIKGRSYIIAPGVFTAKDTVGNNFSGTYTVVAEDPKTFSISYGCTKMSVLGDKCDDASLKIKTRMPFPSKKVIAQINRELKRIWGITVNDLPRSLFRKSCRDELYKKTYHGK
ncbi:hypothetical protein ACF0H5_009843 [Mactra antiquata]